MKKIGILLMLISIIYIPKAFAKDLYVNSFASGSNDGTSWTDAWQNFESINWASVSAGDTIYISGGTSGRTYSGPLTIGKSGSNENNHITIKPGAAHPTLSFGHDGLVTISGGTFGINYGSHDYVTINGNNGKGSTENPYELKDYIAIKITGASHRGVQASKGTGIRLLYIHAYRNGSAGYNEADNIRFSECNGGSEIANCDSEDPYQDGIVSSGPAQYSPSSFGTVKIHHNWIHGMVDDGVSGDGGVDYYNNIIGPWGTWGATGHSDGMQLYAGYLRIYNNLIFCDFMDERTTNALIYLCHSFGSNHDYNHVYVFNNVIFCTGNTYDQRDFYGIYFDGESGPGNEDADDIVIVNNTIVDVGYAGVRISSDGGEAAYTNFIIKNNILLNCGRGGFEAIYTKGWDVDKSSIDIDNNLINGGANGSGYIQWVGTNYTVAQFKSTFNKSNIANTPTFVTYTAGGGTSNDLHLSSSDTAAKDQGTELLKFLNDDKDGISRPKGAGWDIGAYEYGIEDGTPVASFSFSVSPSISRTPLDAKFTNLSYDTDGGTIDVYNWDFGDGIGTSIEKDPNYTYKNPGKYTITLKVTDNEEKINTTAQTIHVKMRAIYIETESVSPSSIMTIGNDANPRVSNKYIYAPVGSGNTTAPSAEAVYNIEIPYSGNYHLWLRMYGPSGDSDAMYIGFNGNFDRVFVTQQEKYEWVRVETVNGSGNFNHTLSAGKNQINIGHGEELARADLICVTDDPDFMPITLFIFK